MEQTAITLTEKEMADVIHEDDFNEALILTQGFIGQPYGDVAGVHFSGKTDKELDMAWSIFKNRKQIILDYLKAEESYL